MNDDCCDGVGLGAGRKVDVVFEVLAGRAIWEAGRKIGWLDG